MALLHCKTEKGALRASGNEDMNTMSSSFPFFYYYHYTCVSTFASSCWNNQLPWIVIWFVPKASLTSIYSCCSQQLLYEYFTTSCPRPAPIYPQKQEPQKLLQNLINLFYTVFRHIDGHQLTSVIFSFNQQIYLSDLFPLGGFDSTSLHIMINLSVPQSFKVASIKPLLKKLILDPEVFAN